jgi:hypothetical protein
MRVAAHSRENLFGFFEKKTTKTYRSGGVTKREMEALAFKAGQRSGDTGLFKEWARSKNLAAKWGDSIRDFEAVYRKGVERGEAIEEKREAKKTAVQEKKEAKREQKLEVAKTVSEVTDALIGQGLSKGKAAHLARTKYAKGDSFDDLWRKVLAKVPKENPSEKHLQAAGFRLVDRYSNRDTAAEVAQKYAPYRLVYQSRRGTAAKWEVWTKQSENPKGGKFDRCISEVEASGTAVNPYAVCEKSVGRKNGKNRKNPLDAAEKLYEDFTGLPATEVLEFQEREHYHKFTAITGRLVCLDILTVDGRELPLIAPGFKFQPAKFLRRDIRHSSEAEAAGASWIADPSFPKDKIVYVTFTEDGKQMIFRGGDQKVPYKDLGLNGRDERDNMFIGTIVQITYRGKKKFEMDGKEEVDFHHPFGGQGSDGILPILGYLLRTERMMTLGGRYRIAPVRGDIKASPGIVG